MAALGSAPTGVADRWAELCALGCRQAQLLQRDLQPPQLASMPHGPRLNGGAARHVSSRLPGCVLVAGSTRQCAPQVSSCKHGRLAGTVSCLLALWLAGMCHRLAALEVAGHSSA